MINNKPFIITYYSASDKKTITRNALWNDQCKYWISKSGRMLMTYFDVDQNGYRTASDSWKVRKQMSIKVAFINIAVLLYGYIILTILGVI